MGKFQNLAGIRFGRLVARRRAETVKGNIRWHCSCDCGQHTIVCAANLKTGRQVSCGCYMIEAATKAGAESAVHGHARGSKSGTYLSWIGLCQRCLNPNATGFDNYGGRGIKVCDRWSLGADGKSGFECFLDDMGERPEGTQIERTDNNGHYEPSNCEWATRKVQALNKRTTRLADKDIAAIHAAKAQGQSSRSIAAQYGVHSQYICQILRGDRRAA